MEPSPLAFTKGDDEAIYMKRGEYLDTAEGQVSLRRKRQLKRLQFMLDDQEPRSKKAISQREKVAFQKAILAKMTEQNRRHFRASIAIEFDFFPTQNDPPALHTMPKNYLDLLERPVVGMQSRRKHIVFDNDRQVSYLSARYHIGTGDSPRPSIWIKAAPYRNFV